MSIVDQIILLHDIDSKLFEINKLLGGLPTQVEELTQQQEALKNSLLEKENSLKTATVDIQTSETFIATAQEKVNTLKDRLTDGSISTNKEYDAMMDSIDYEKSKLRVSVVIFGRATPVELEFGQIEKEV